MKRAPAKPRNSLGRFQESWCLDERASAGGPPAKIFLPPTWGRWKFRHYVKRGRDHFVGDGGTLNGQRLRVWADSPEKVLGKAAAKQKEIDQHGQLANALTTAQRWTAAESFLVCERLGVNLLDVVRQFESTHPHGPNARTIDQLRLELIASKRKLDRSELHVRSLDYRFRSLIDAIGDKPLTAITRQELQHELERHPEWNPTTISSVVQGWKIGFNFAIRHGWLVTNPANGLDLPKIVRGEPTILTIEEAMKLLAATLFKDRDPILPECRAFLAIGMFAGLRPSEMVQLEWRHVDLDAGTIRVTAGSAKDRDRRIVAVEPNLTAWLKPIARNGGGVLRFGLDKLHAAARRVLEWTEWPQDVLRHTFASYHFAEWENEARTKKQMGHRDDGRVFYNHYCVPVASHLAHLFWAIYPPAGLLPCYTPGWAEMHPVAQLALG